MISTVLAATETKSFSLTGLPAVLVIVVVLAVLVGIGVLIGRRRRR